MLTWVKKLYVEPGLEKKAGRILKNIQKGRLSAGIYLVTAASNEANLLEIHPAVLLCQKSLRDRCPIILGMARGKENALELVRQMVAQTYEQTGGFAVKDYLQDR